jgi:hypothetical protein
MDLALGPGYRQTVRLAMTFKGRDEQAHLQGMAPDDLHIV